MQLVKPSYEIMEIMGKINDPLKLIERAGRTCYKSEGLITKDSSLKFVEKIRDLGHFSVLEHSAMTVKFICDRGVSHELVRHRLASFSQESTRYCNYKGGVTFVIPPWIPLAPLTHEFTTLPEFPDKSEELNYVEEWLSALLSAEETYIFLLSKGWSPQQARSVLPNSLKTEIVVTANLREWHHIFDLRTSLKAHPQMRELMVPLLEEVRILLPIIFDNIGVNKENDI